MNVSKKRKADAHEGERVKRSRGPDGARPVQPEKSSARDKGHIAPVSKPGPSLINGDGNSGGSGESRAKEKRKSTDIDADQLGVDKGRPAKPKHKIKKLVPPRPFPTVPTSVSATGPRSAHKEGKNYICLTRKTPLGAYLRRCKDVILKDGYKTLHLSAMGAAIPHLATLAVSLPSILPFAADEIHTEILTGTVEVQDEIIPEDEDEDISYQTRGKSTLRVVIKIGDGDDEVQPNVGTNVKGKTGPKTTKHGGRKGKGQSEQIVFQEPEQEDMDVA